MPSDTTIDETRAGAAAPRPADRARARSPAAGIVKVNQQGAFAIRLVTLSVMLVPFAGFVEAVRLTLVGQVAATAWVLFAVMYFIHMAGVSMGFHRMAAHLAFKAGRATKLAMLIAGSTAAQGPLLYWVATHRRHHAFSDREGDPHSPHLKAGPMAKLRGLWWSHMPWMLSEETSSWGRWAKDIMGDRTAFFVHRTYFVWLFAGLAVPAAVGGLVLGSWAGVWQGFIFGGLARMFVANQFAWCVGSVCHMFGGRPFANRDESTNSWWVAVFTFGEGLQNNHHAFPWWHRHGVKWFEPDLSGWLLTGMGKLGIVWGLRDPSPTKIARVRRKIPGAAAPSS